MFYIIDSVRVSLRYNALQEKLNVNETFKLLPVVFGIAS
jgi:hypothetical protein